MSILSFTALSKTLPGGRTLFADVSADIEEPQSVALLAPSGQGKSTLLRLLALLDEPSGGEVRLDGKPSAGWHPQAWRRRAAYVAQQAVMLPGTIAHNVGAFSRLHGAPFDRDRAAKLMDAAGLAATDWEKDAAELSGGEKQRVALVRSLMARPAVLLLDEATASLDEHSKLAVEGLLADALAAERTTLVWVTHDLEQARRVGSRVWFLSGGGLADSEADAFFREPPSEAAERFLKRGGTEADPP
ncbi:putative ABC transport system ATP-binding protein [Paenibacillus sp. UNC496MF]|uniref:ABC transporter ATP-binding protein n=1 Tax=Paenibacillus sp. UNC496MF TaxID=1502753 RepID=UPI0008E96085|nr:ATP-binding cassette domain-containing protein [Paenibacillus sp. UNC496MF]SFI34122.1 putative ABC transport system ATP-binding protein [Paenibacillus sp. UNC496MF]